LQQGHATSSAAGLGSKGDPHGGSGVCRSWNLSTRKRGRCGIVDRRRYAIGRRRSADPGPLRACRIDGSHYSKPATGCHTDANIEWPGPASVASCSSCRLGPETGGITPVRRPLCAGWHLEAHWTPKLSSTQTGDWCLGEQWRPGPSDRRSPRGIDQFENGDLRVTKKKKNPTPAPQKKKNPRGGGPPHRLGNRFLKKLPGDHQPGWPRPAMRRSSPVKWASTAIVGCGDATTNHRRMEKKRSRPAAARGMWVRRTTEERWLYRLGGTGHRRSSLHPHPDRW